MDKRDEKLLRMLSEAVTSAPLEDRAAALRVLDAALGLLNSRAAVAHSAHWFLENRTVAGNPGGSDGFRELAGRAGFNLRKS